MKRLFVVALASMLLSGLASAQSTPAWELSGGYLRTRQFDPCCGNANGFTVSLQENRNNWFGGVFEFGLSLAPHNEAQFFTFMFGPQVTYRKSSVLQPFVRGLIGGARDSVTNGPNDTGFAVNGGAGLDIRVSQRVFFRLNTGFIRTSVFGTTLKFGQAGAGVVYRFGSTVQNP